MLKLHSHTVLHASRSWHALRCCHAAAVAPECSTWGPMNFKVLWSSEHAGVALQHRDSWVGEGLSGYSV